MQRETTSAARERRLRRFFGAIAVAAVVGASALVSGAPSYAATPAIRPSNTVVNTLSEGMGYNVLQLMNNYFWPENIAGRALTETEWNTVFEGMGWSRSQLARVGAYVDWYEPTNNSFTWNSAPMTRLYRVLGELQERNVNVYIQNWGGHDKLNPENHLSDWLFSVTSSPSAPSSVSEFASAQAALINHLVNVKGFTNVIGWGTANEKEIPLSSQATIIPAVRTALDNVGLSSIKIYALDAYSDPGEWSGIDASKVDVGTYHEYETYFQQPPTDPINQARAVLGSKPVIQSELGKYSSAGGGVNDPTQIYLGSVAVAESIVRSLHQGVNGFLQWEYLVNGPANAAWNNFSFLSTEDPNYLWKTQNTNYYNAAIVQRYVAKGWKVLESTVAVTSGVYAVVLRSADNSQTTTIITNGSPNAMGYHLDLSLLSSPPTSVNGVAVTGPSIPVSLGTIPLTGGVSADLTIAGKSVVVLTTQALGTLTSPDTNGRLANPSPNRYASATAQYQLVNANSGMCAAVDGASTADSATISQQPCVASDQSQAWRVAAAGGENFRITNVGSNKSLEIPNNVTGGAASLNGYRPYQNTTGTASHQQWRIVPTSGGNVRIANSEYPLNYVLDVDGASTTAGTKVQLWSYGGAACCLNQQWQIAPIVNAAIGSAVSASSTLNNFGWSLPFVADGQRASVSGALGWTSNNSLTTNHTEWVQFDFSSRTVREVALLPRSDSGNVGVGYPIDFTIQYWNGSSWVTAVTRTGQAQPGAGPQAFTFGPVTTTRIRVNATSLRPYAGDYRMQLAEVEIY